MLKRVSMLKGLWVYSVCSFVLACVGLIVNWLGLNGAFFFIIPFLLAIPFLILILIIELLIEFEYIKPIWE